LFERGKLRAEVHLPRCNDGASARLARGRKSGGRKPDVRGDQTDGWGDITCAMDERPLRETRERAFLEEEPRA
jgi:hypothetical protein